MTGPDLRSPTEVALAQAIGELRHRREVARGALGWRLTRPLRAVRRRPAPVEPEPEAPIIWTDGQHALAARLDVVAPALDPSVDMTASAAVGPTVAPSEAIERFTGALLRSGLADPAVAWYAAVAAYGHWPDDDELDALTDAAALHGRRGLAARLWRESVRQFAGGAAPLTRVALARSVVVDVTAATISGPVAVQRFVSETVDRWPREHGREPLERVAWTEAGPQPLTAGATLLVPVDAAWVVADPIPHAWRAERYRTLARAGVTRQLSAIVVDTIPAASPELVPPGVPATFAASVSALRGFDTLVAMGDGVAAEWRGVTAMLGALGVDGPAVLARPLPGGTPSPEEPAGRAGDGPPTLLVTGDAGRIGNLATVLVAVERLWQDGVRFRVAVGAEDPSEPAAALLAELTAAGRPIERLELAEGAEEALVMVRISLAGGLELVIVDSLVAGTPVLTSGFGAMGELAGGGGVVTVDPRDADALEAALRNLLPDASGHQRLVREARSRTFPTWDEHAAATWELVAGIGARRARHHPAPPEIQDAGTVPRPDPSALADQEHELRALQADLATMPSTGSGRLGARLDGLVAAGRHGRPANAGRRVAAKAQQLAGRARTKGAAAPAGPPSDDPGLRRRLRAATEAISGQGGDAGLAAFGQALATVPRAAAAWWSWVVVTATYPTDDELDALLVVAERGGPVALVAWVVEEHGRRLGDGTASERGLRVEPGAVFVDVTHTAAHDINTGVQRVTRGVAERWHADHGAELFAWNGSGTDAAVLTDGEVARFSAWRERVGHAGGSDGPDVQDVADVAAPDTAGDVLVPWKATVLIPELAAEPRRATRYRTIARAGITERIGLIGHDTLPLTAADTAPPGMSEAFAGYLSLVKHADRVSANSATTAASFEGLGALARSQGLLGPVVAAHLLAVEVPEVAPDRLLAARTLLSPDGLPLVLVVGSHEPRKNHVTVLVAAERLWRSGLAFRLTFIGGNGWRAERFHAVVDELRTAGRPVEVLLDQPEDALFAAYRLARFSVFPSIAEGFGLPIVESLLSGTPVITSSYGSMAEAAAFGGAVTVDPRDASDLERAMRALLTDDEALATLAAQAKALRWKTWDEYAAQTWHHLTES